MRETILRAAVFVRFALLGVIVVTAIIADYRKFPSPTQVIDQEELDGLCQSVQGCKSLHATRIYGNYSVEPGIRYIVTQDKKAKTREVRESVSAGLDRLWSQNVKRWSPARDDMPVEVRGE